MGLPILNNELGKLFRSVTFRYKKGYATVAIPCMMPWRIENIDPPRYFVNCSYDKSADTTDIVKMVSNSVEVSSNEYTRLAALRHEFDANPGQYLLGNKNPDMWQHCPKCQVISKDGVITGLACMCSGDSGGSCKKCETSCCCSICECGRSPCRKR